MTHGSSFSGIGGFDLAAEWVGWQNLFNCEIDPFCQTVLKHHFPDAEQFTDIRTADFARYKGRIDVLTGGFPCQSFSVAGKRKGTEDDRYLWPEMLGVIRVVRPRWVVGENVYGIVSWSDGLVFEQVCADLEAEGYEVQPYVLPACGVGAPHQRYRTWFVAHRADAGIEDVRERKDEILSGGDAADTTNKRCRERIGQGFQIRKRGVFQGEQTGCPLGSTVAGSDCERPAPHTDGRGLPERDAEPGRKESYTATQRHCSIPNWRNFPTQSPVRRGDDGLSDWLDFDAVFEGIPTPRRIKKAYNRWREQAIKAYGNAVVPQVVLQIFETINEYEALSRAERSGK